MGQLKKHTSQDLSGLRYRTRVYKSGLIWTQVQNQRIQVRTILDSGIGLQNIQVRIFLDSGTRLEHTSQDLSGLRYRTRTYKSGLIWTQVQDKNTQVRTYLDSGIGLEYTSQDLSGLRYRTRVYKSGIGLEYTIQDYS